MLFCSFFCNRHFIMNDEMSNPDSILSRHYPCPAEVNEHIRKWNGLEDYVNQERALDKLFLKLCPKSRSHHRPDIYPIYDNYVHKLLMYFKKRDVFCKLKSEDLKDYGKYCKVIKCFSVHYGLESFSVKEMDKYLWQLGKEAFNRYK